MAAQSIPGDHMKEGWGVPDSSSVATVQGPFQLDCGLILPQITLAYNTYGKLDADGTNCAIVGHSLTSNSCVHEWWSALMGEGPAFALDTTRYFVVCVNYLGSVYGSDSPLTPNPVTRERYSADFPVMSIRDNVRAQRALLDSLGVKRVSLAIGGSLGGMLALEWAATYPDYVDELVVVAAPAAHGGWAIGINEVERQAIYADTKWQGGRYPLSDPPLTGMAVARQLAMVTYRSPQSFDAKFGRACKPTAPQASCSALPKLATSAVVNESPSSEAVVEAASNSISNETAVRASPRDGDSLSLSASPEASPSHTSVAASPPHGMLTSPTGAYSVAEGSPLPLGRLRTGAQFGSNFNLAAAPLSLGAAASLPSPSTIVSNGMAGSPSMQQQLLPEPPAPPTYEVEGYLRYQGQKFIRRFDPLCYVRLTQTLDTHDVGAGRSGARATAVDLAGGKSATQESVRAVLSSLPQRTFVVGIDSDLLYPLDLQREMASSIPRATLYVISSPHGHDSFLIEIKQLNDAITRWLQLGAREGTAA